MLGDSFPNSFVVQAVMLSSAKRERNDLRDSPSMGLVLLSPGKPAGGCAWSSIRIKGINEVCGYLIYKVHTDSTDSKTD